ncbi:MAG: alkaline phosphatase family protein [Solirubrobacteraceae bacterium]
MEDVRNGLTRRDLLKVGAAAGGAAAGFSALDPNLMEALAWGPRCGQLKDIEHFVIFMNENRSFDHYFGTYRGVRGFADRRGRRTFAQPGYEAPGFDGVIRPYHLDSFDGKGECTNDVDHEWAVQHQSWNGGRMDGFYTARKATQGADNAALVMGYYERKDLEFYYALADNFTLCDEFFCSVIGPTDPNRLYAMSGMLDPTGANGGPLLETLVAGRAAMAGKFTWTTYPEQLEAKGVSWKVYTSPAGGVFQNVLPYFHNFQTDPTLKAKGITPTYPSDFLADVSSGNLPAVSWILPDLSKTEHPPFAPTLGEFVASQALGALSANKDLWAKTAFIITYDEQGGFFDHVNPRTPPPGTPGEYVTVDPLPVAAEGIPGPIGLGFRIPTLIVSPYARGGLVSSKRFDHTSVLRLLETRFGAEVPNLTRWRRRVVDDLVEAFNFAAVDQSVPPLPEPSTSDPRVTTGTCQTFKPVPILPTANVQPGQEPGRARCPSGPCRCGRPGHGRRW